MKKKIWVGIAIVLGLFIIYEIYQFATTRSHSPEETVKIDTGKMEVSVTYCRPYKKDRLIFGEESKDALVPYGKYWRLGANDATEITFSSDVLFAEKEEVPAGTYRMYAVPGKEQWEISLNSELGQFGFFEPDYSLDVAKVKVNTLQIDDTTEQFTIQFESKRNAVKMSIIWDNTVVEIPIQKI